MVFIVTNQAGQRRVAGDSSARAAAARIANTGPINPQATAQVTVNFGRGVYTVATTSTAATEAARAAASPIHSATLVIGRPRPSGSASSSSPSRLLQP